MIILPVVDFSSKVQAGWWVQWLRSLSLTILSLCLLNVSNYFHCLITSMTRKPRPIFISPTETWRIEECSVGTERIYKICFLEIKGSGGMKEFHGVKLRCAAVWCWWPPTMFNVCIPQWQLAHYSKKYYQMDEKHRVRKGRNTANNVK